MFAKRFFLALFLAILSCSATAAADDFPTHPVHIVLPFPPGGALDTYMRIISPALNKALGQPVVIENMSGAGGAIGAVNVARARPDGYKILAAPIQTLGINPAVYTRLPYDPLKDFSPVIETVNVNYVMVVNPSLPIHSVPELIAYAKARPGKVTYASSGIGSPQQLAVAIFQSRTGLDLVHIPYKGVGAAITDLLAGRVNMAIADQPSMVQYVKNGQLRALAVAGARRSPDLPDLPSIAEAASLPGFDVVAWQGIVVPAHTPAPVIEKLNRAFNEALNEPATKARLEKLGFAVVGGTPQEFGSFLQSQIARWKKVAKDNNIKAD